MPQSKAVKVFISIAVLGVAGILGNLSLLGFSYIINGTAETSDTVLTLICTVVFWGLFIGLFKIKNFYDLKWARRLFIFAPIILIMLILIFGATIVSFRQ